VLDRAALKQIAAFEVQIADAAGQQIAAFEIQIADATGGQSAACACADCVAPVAGIGAAATAVAVTVAPVAADVPSPRPLLFHSKSGAALAVASAACHMATNVANHEQSSMT
jgi:hypothetical protein